MTALDWIVVALAVLSAFNGARRGFVAGALALAGFVAGAFAGARLAPLLLEGGSTSPWAPLFALAGALALGIALAGLLEALGTLLLDRFRVPAVETFDAALGAVLGVAIAVVLAWIIGAVALHTPGARALRGEVQRSAILSALNDAFPPSGPLLRALARFDPLPSIAGPSPDAISPPSREALRQPGARRAADGTVRVLGAACGLAVSGSGWIAARDIVVTNAHVVAGTGDELTVQLPGGGERRTARTVHFDSLNDIALLAAPGLGGTRLRLADSSPPGTAGAILGYPRNGPFDARAARIGDTLRVLAHDVYGRGPLLRTMTAIRGTIRPGNSGGPVVDRAGRVLTTVFATAEGGSARGGFGVPNALVERALESSAARPRTVSTGACVS